MQFTFIANACCIFTGSEGTRILCDPWLIDGAFDSWCHDPPLTTKVEDLLDVDAIYISHIHPDHLDERTLQHFPKHIPILALDYGPNFVLKKMRDLGFTELVRIHDKETLGCYEFDITMFKTFATGHEFPANGGELLDSAMLIADDESNCFNFNDNNPTLEAANWLREEYGPFDLALLPCTIAGPYPACFTNLSHEEKLAERDRILAMKRDHVTQVAAILKPKVVRPFAGEYALGGPLHTLNQYLSPIQHGDLSDRLRYSYMDDPEPQWGALCTDTLKASYKLEERMVRYNLKSDCDVWIVFKDEDQRMKIHQGNGTKKLVCSMDRRLLRRILDGRMNWNEAEIGCHIQFHREPNDYDIALHTGLTMFHL